MEALIVVHVGEIAYEDAWALQRKLHQARCDDLIGDHLLLLSHPHTLTAGTRGGKPDRWENLQANRGDLLARGVALIDSDRGGDLTWQGPGQLVAYPIVHLGAYGSDVGHYVWMLEAMMIRALSALGIEAARSPGYPGVWIGSEKIAAIGARIQRWVTMHGVALNLRGPLEGFGWILPCGLEGRGVTSVERQLPSPPPSDADILALVTDAAGAVFDRAVEIRQEPQPIP